MTAAETYYESIEKGFLPATVPVQSIDGTHLGIATQPFLVLGTEIEARALSDQLRDRAVAAVLACHQARLAVEQKFETVTPL